MFSSLFSSSSPVFPISTDSNPPIPISFAKYHGCENDFIILDHNNISSPQLNLFELEDSKENSLFQQYFAKQICNRYTGIGADQILIVNTNISSKEEKDYDCSMYIINCDGSIAEMCGNGIRALGLYLHLNYYEKLGRKLKYKVKTMAGPQTIEIIVNKHENTNIYDNYSNCMDIKVVMNIPQLLSTNGELLHLQLKNNESPFILPIYTVSMGNPHCVIFMDKSPLFDIETFPLSEIGPLIENNSQLFPNKTNVEIVEIINRNEIKVKVWERGAGLTKACGTGACAAAVAAIYLNKVENNKEIKVNLPGGQLLIQWDKEKINGSNVLMTGKAVNVFNGKFNYIPFKK